MEGSTRYATFFIIFSIAFTYFSYAFAFTSFDQETWDLAIDYEDVFAAGIMLGDNDEMNLTYGSGYQLFNFSNAEVRIDWGFRTGIGDRFNLQSHVSLFGVDVAWSTIGVRDHATIYNSTLLAVYNNETQWSHFKLKNGYELFFTDPLKLNNMTRAIYVDGIVLVTLAESMDFTTNTNLLTFVSWYANMITGQNDYGLPSVLGVVIQTITALSLLSVVIIAKEMISL